MHRLLRPAVLGLALGGAAALARRLRGTGPEQRYTREPDQLPNEPDRPAGVTPPPSGTDA